MSWLKDRARAWAQAAPMFVGALLTVAYVAGRDAAPLGLIPLGVLVTTLCVGLFVMLGVEDVVRVAAARWATDARALRHVAVAAAAGIPLVVGATRWYAVREYLPTWTLGVLVGVAVVVGAAILKSPAPPRHRAPRWAAGLAAAAVLLTAGHAWMHDANGTMLAVRPGTGLLHLGLYVATWVASATLVMPFALRFSAPDGSGDRSAVEPWIGIATAVVGMAFLEADRRLFVDLYIDVHLWLGAIGVLALDTGARWLLSGAPWRGGARQVGAFAGVLLLVGCGWLVVSFDDARDIRTRSALGETAFGSSLLHVLPTKARARRTPGKVVDRGYAQYLDEPAPLDQPNIVLLSIDTVRGDVLLDNGKRNFRMPHLQRLANESLNFRKAWAQGPLTPMGMGTLMVGRWAANIDWELWFWKRGRFSNPKKMPAAQLAKMKGRHVFTSLPEFGPGDSLAMRLKAAGYATAGAAYTPGDFFRPGVGFDRGFDEFADLTRVKWKWPTSQRIVNRSLAQLDKIKKHKPWFVWIHLYDPHENKRIHKKYDKLLKHTDDAVGSLRRELEKRGLFEDTVIAVVSDHGEAMGEHRHGGHGTSLYDEQTRIPMLLRIPGIEGRDVPHNAAAIDLTATLAVAAGASVDDLDGVNLFPLAVEGRYPKDRPIYTECHRYMKRDGKRSRDIKAVIQGDHKLIVDRLRSTTMLFDLAKDPKELQNLRESDPATYNRLLDGLTEFGERGDANHPLPELD